MRQILAFALVALALGASALAQTGGSGDRRTITFPNGDVFSGEIRNGLPNGPGTLTTHGRTYSGEWKEGCLAVPDGRRFAVNTTLDKCPIMRKQGFSRPDPR